VPGADAVKSVRIEVEYEDGRTETWPGMVGVVFDSEDMMLLEVFPKETPRGEVKEIARWLRDEAKSLERELKRTEKGRSARS